LSPTLRLQKHPAGLSPQRRIKRGPNDKLEDR